MNANPPFDDASTGTPFSFTAYHWREGMADGSVLFEKILKRKVKPNFFVVDTPTDWSTGNRFRIKMQVSVKNPFVIQDDKVGLEERMLNRKWLSLVKRNGYDSVISVPVGVVSTRQAILFYPNEQIKSAEYSYDGHSSSSTKLKAKLLRY